MATKLMLKELSTKPERLVSGHRMCPGCGAPTIVRQIMMAIDEPVVVANATGCLEVSTSIYPFTSWAVPWIHSAFENAAATISGVEATYQSLKRQGKISETVRFIAFGGDGGTYDIGFQALSGAMERGHKIMYVCYDNGAYMNTGIQRSSATPFGANTTTSPTGTVKTAGKMQYSKDLTAIMAAHNIPYVAQASPHNWRDLMKKARKGAENGPAFLNVISNCNRGWRHSADLSIEMCRLAVETCAWPLFEVENGEWKLSYKPKEKLPVTAWIEGQGRFRHLFQPQNRHLIDELQAEVDRRWEKLLKLCGEA